MFPSKLIQAPRHQCKSFIISYRIWPPGHGRSTVKCHMATSG